MSGWHNHQKDILHDLPHVGALSRRIRESRGLRPTDIAHQCNVSPATITRNLEERNATMRETFECYVNALYKHGHPPLTGPQAGMLLHLYDHSTSNMVALHQAELAAIHLEDIRSANCPTALTGVVEELRREDRPAFIVDALGFVHALNGSMLRLFNIDPYRSHYLFCWEAWHVIATKFHRDSPVRMAHVNPDECFPPTLQFFFESTHPYLFTFQMRILLAKLHQLSAQQGFLFTHWWTQACTFSLSYELKALTRTVRFEEQYVQVEAMRRMDQQVELVPGYVVPYTLAVWNPLSYDARQVFETLCGFPDSHKVFYAAEYDVNANFHVNKWPQVKEESQKWLE